MALTRKQKVSFYRNKKKVGKTVLKEIKNKKLILFGARSLNRQLPLFLRKETKDYDVILTKRDPKKVARSLERKLDKKFKGNIFIVEKGKAPGVFKVKNVLGKEGVIDVVKSDRKVPFVKRKGVRVSTLAFEKEKIKESLSNPEAKFRHDKDRERRDRIRIFENMKKRRGTISKKKKSVRVRFLPRRLSRTRIPRFRSIDII
jgi:hypothetical protein